MSNIVYPRYKAWKANGTSPAAGYYLYTYASGTTIPKTTYSDNLAVPTPNANPIILDSNGEAVIFSGGSGSYKFTLKTPAGAVINTFDPVANVLGGLAGSIVSYVENIADLRALVISTEALVEVLGYFAGGDEGGGSFWFDVTSTAADDQGTVIRPDALPATGRWIRRWTAPLSVKWFGWTGAGGAPDATALAAFNTYTAALTLGGEFYVPGQITLHHLDTNKANVKFITESADTLKAGIEWAKAASINSPTAKIWNRPDFDLNLLSNTGTIDFYIGTYVAGDKVLSLSSNFVIVPATQGLKVTDLAGVGTRFATVLATGEISVGAAVSSFIDGAGTATYLPIFIDANTIGDSVMNYDSGLGYFNTPINVGLNIGGAILATRIATAALPSVSVSSSAPDFAIINTSGAADEKRYIFTATPTTITFNTATDAGVAVAWLTGTRSGNALSLLTIVPPTKYTAVGTQLIPSLQVSSTSAMFGIRAATAAANEHDYTFWADTGFLQFSTVNDAGTAVAWLKATRSGNAISNLVITTTTNSLTGKVGIGNGGTPTDWLEISADEAVQQIMTSYGTTGGVNLQMRQAKGTKAAPTTILNGDYLFEIEAFAYTGAWFETAEIKAIVDGAVVANQAPPVKLEFYTNIVNQVPQLRVTLSSVGTLVTMATAAAAAGLNLPHGTVPSSPVNGDIWTTSAGGLFGRINGVTQNYAPLASPTFTGTVTVSALTANGLVTFNAGIAASGATANTWAGGSGTFITSTGANTLSGAVDVNAATTPSITLNSGKTNTGFLLINGKTSGSLKLITADATAQAVTFNLAAQTVGSATLTFPDLVGVAKTVPYLEQAQTFTAIQTFSNATTTFSNVAAFLGTGTVDGADSSAIVLSSAGAVGSSRGAYVRLFGNEHASVGAVDIAAGAAGTITIYAAGVSNIQILSTGATKLLGNTATTAGGSTVGITLGTSGVVGIYFGSGAPTISAAQGALYLRTDGSSTSTRAYINTTGSTTWTAITTAA